jgi:hypothetical protein
VSVSPAPDPMESLFTLSPDEQRVFTLEAPPRPPQPMAVSTPEDAASDIEATTIDSEDSVEGDKRPEGEGILSTLVEGTPDLLEFVFSDVLGSLLEWLE